jgi:ketosteroid isomerase-like protein
MAGRDRGSESQHAAIIRRTYELFSSDDAHGMAELWCDDIVWHIAGANTVSGDHIGVDAILGMLGDVMALTQGTFQVEIKDIATSGDRGYSLHKATAMTDGGVAEFWNVLSFRFANGKIAEVWNYAYDQSVDDMVLS